MSNYFYYGFGNVIILTLFSCSYCSIQFQKFANVTGLQQCGTVIESLYAPTKMSCLGQCLDSCAGAMFDESLNECSLCHYMTTPSGPFGSVVYEKIGPTSSTRVYTFVNKTMTWYDAHDYCKDGLLMEGLAVVETEADLATLQQTMGGNDNVWIGAFRVESSTDPWMWVSANNSNVDMSLAWFAPGEPNMANGPACIHIYQSYNWDDTQCHNMKTFMCSSDGSISSP